MQKKSSFSNCKGTTIFTLFNYKLIYHLNYNTIKSGHLLIKKKNTKKPHIQS